jgi:division protein CdvB (Snf7/Vps24/ESCRT-III family)
MTNGHHSLRPADPLELERWREEAGQREQVFARQGRLEELERQRAAEALAATECARLRAELANLRTELANLRAELDQRRQADFEAIIEAVVACSNDLKALTKLMLAELFDKIDSKFAALRARADEDTKSALRVARERADEVSELPDPLPPRRAIN